MRDATLKTVYASMVAEASARLLAASRFLAVHQSTASVPDLEASILQVRKALEAIAYAAIAPNKREYAALRAKATEASDFTKDYHAKKIFAALSRLNKDFYPHA